ncbi:hypothetical protein Pelo_3257 [Pelomyxa schiedti]|nr:hypothetical protein Pelo_3257 [Pelomyxa schiedti]
MLLGQPVYRQTVRNVSVVVGLPTAWQWGGEASESMVGTMTTTDKFKWVALDALAALDPDAANDRLLDVYLANRNSPIKGGLVISFNGKDWPLGGTNVDNFKNVTSWVDAVASILCEHDKAQVQGAFTLTASSDRFTIQNEKNPNEKASMNLHAFMNMLLGGMRWAHKFTSEFVRFLEAHREFRLQADDPQRAAVSAIIVGYGKLMSILMESMARLEGLWSVYPTFATYNTYRTQQQQQQQMAHDQSQSLNGTQPAKSTVTISISTSTSASTTTTQQRSTPAQPSKAASAPITDWAIQQQLRQTTEPVAVAGVQSWPSLGGAKGKKTKRS